MDEEEVDATCSSQDRLIVRGHCDAGGGGGADWC